MARSFAIAALIVISGCRRGEGEASPPAPVLVWIEADPAIPLEVTLAKEAAAATAAGRKPVAYLHADWCAPCVALEKSREDPRMKAVFAKAHVIAIDTDDHEAGPFEKLGLTHSIPLFFALDAKGSLTGERIGVADWGESRPELMAPRLAEFFAR